MIKPPLCWISFVRPIQHFIVRVQFLNIHLVTSILFTLIWNFITTLWNFVDHNIVKFRDMKNFDMESFSNNLISHDILNGSQDNDDTSYNGQGGN